MATSVHIMSSAAESYYSNSATGPGLNSHQLLSAQHPIDVEIVDNTLGGILYIYPSYFINDSTEFLDSVKASALQSVYNIPVAAGQQLLNVTALIKAALIQYTGVVNSAMYLATEKIAALYVLFVDANDQQYLSVPTYVSLGWFNNYGAMPAYFTNSFDGYDWYTTYGYRRVFQAIMGADEANSIKKIFVKPYAVIARQSGFLSAATYFANNTDAKMDSSFYNLNGINTLNLNELQSVDYAEQLRIVDVPCPTKPAVLVWVNRWGGLDSLAFNIISSEPTTEAESYDAYRSFDQREDYTIGQQKLFNVTQQGGIKNRIRMTLGTPAITDAELFDSVTDIKNSPFIWYLPAYKSVSTGSSGMIVYDSLFRELQYQQVYVEPGTISVFDASKDIQAMRFTISVAELDYNIRSL